MTAPRTASLLCGALALLLMVTAPLHMATSWNTSTTVSAQAATATDAGTTTPPTSKTTQSVSVTDDAHSASAAPNYAVVFPANTVSQLTITIAPEDWSKMQANMTELFGERGTRSVGPGGPAGGPPMMPEGGGPPPGDVDAAGQPVGAPPMPPDGGPGGPGGGDFAVENPVWVPATVGFNGQTWSSVGVRYKGNSSLMSGWGSGTLKLPFKLNFDEFEDTDPTTKNQRFYGFEQLSLGNNFGDATYMRDTIAYDLLDEAGLPAANTAFYEVVVDYGEGPVNLGIYTAVEVIDDTVIAREFGDDSGNIYEADGRAATLAAGTFDQIHDSFQKENNTRAADWSDVETLYTVLHSNLRTTDPAAWRAQLEAIFDVDGFLEWLAISGVIQHWDTYGQMTHNYYLYHDPATDKLTWISWDHNMVLGVGGGGGARPGAAPVAAAGDPVAEQAVPAAADPNARPNAAGGAGMGPGRGNVSLDKKSVGDSWPLIRFLLDDPTYYAAYVGYLDQTATTLVVPDRLAAKYQSLATLLAPYAEREGTQAAFAQGVQALTATTYERAKVAADFLATQP